MAREIPNIVIGRLPIYLRELTRLAAENQKATTSSHELGKRLGISSAQIRKDLSHFGEFGKQGTGYHISYLIDQLRDILHLDREWEVALVGAGYLGHALVHYDGFSRHGFRITCIFDNDPAKIGEQVNELIVQNISEMQATIQAKGIEIAILVVPAVAAQATADHLIASGIKSILTYAPIFLETPENIQVSYSDPVVQLQRMTFYLSP